MLNEEGFSKGSLLFGVWKIRPLLYDEEAIRILWNAGKNSTPEVGHDYILVEIGSDSSRLRDIFKGHPAWNTMIVSGETAGSFRLFEPKIQ